MPTPHRLSKQDARRVAVRAQVLTNGRPPDLLTAVQRLTTLQLDPVSAVAPSADLVAWSRLGNDYHPADLKSALDSRALIELQAFLRPSADISLYRAEMAEMAAWPDITAEARGKLRDWEIFYREWVRANDRCRRDILARLTDSGPLPSRDLPDTCEKPWRSTGWTNNKNVTRLLDLMASRGEVAVAGRKGKERLWDLAERVYPDAPAVPAAEALRERNRRRLAALGIARSAGPDCVAEPGDVGQTGEPAVIDDVKGEWRVDPTYLGGAPGVGEFAGRVVLLSPFDRLVHDRIRATEIFEFEYQLEMYKPAASRRWGYYALPILFGDQLVGKLDAAADRKAGVFTVNAVHEDVPFTADMRAAVDAEIANLADWLGLGLRVAAQRA
jgi:uncharacterized protein YcaQ